MKAASVRAARSPPRPESRESSHAPGRYPETQDHEPARADFRRQSLRRSPPAFTWPVSLGSLPHFIEVDERRMRQHKRAERLRRSHMRAAAPPEYGSAAAPPRYERAAAPQEREGAAAPPEREERLRRCSTEHAARHAGARKRARSLSEQRERAETRELRSAPPTSTESAEGERGTTQPRRTPCRQAAREPRASSNPNQRRAES